METSMEVKKRIHDVFPTLEVSIYPDETEDNIIVAIDDAVYYSDRYQSIILDITMNFLWKQDVFNYLFVKEKPQEIHEKVIPRTAKEYRTLVS
jgi:hypothetical protein